VDGNGRVLGTYDKNFLLVFGEYIPFGERFPKLYEYLPEAGKFKSGSGFKTFELKDMRIGIMICYEDIIPRFTRRLAGRNANILVNITNDAWFGHTSEPFQHLALATTRAIENRVFLVRSTNTGVSAFIDPLGRILKHTDLDNPETLISEVSLLDKETIYRQTGDVFAFGCCIAVSVMLLISMFSRRKK
jgi:apolipoprotein N-acyltransferase